MAEEKKNRANKLRTEKEMFKHSNCNRQKSTPNQANKTKRNRAAGPACVKKKKIVSPRSITCASRLHPWRIQIVQVGGVLQSNTIKQKEKDLMAINRFLYSSFSLLCFTSTHQHTNPAAPLRLSLHIYSSTERWFKTFFFFLIPFSFYFSLSLR